MQHFFRSLVPVRPSCNRRSNDSSSGAKGSSDTGGAGSNGFPEMGGAADGTWFSLTVGVDYFISFIASSSSEISICHLHWISAEFEKNDAPFASETAPVSATLPSASKLGWFSLPTADKIGDDLESFVSAQRLSSPSIRQSQVFA